MRPSRVVLPAPLAPSRPVTPSPTVNEAPASAGVVDHRFVTSTAVTTGPTALKATGHWRQGDLGRRGRRRGLDQVKAWGD